MSENLCSVRLIGFPLGIFRQAQEHHDGLMREFSIISLGEQHGHDPTVPVRLLALIDRLTRDYSNINDQVDVQRDKALANGLESVDLTYLAPADAAEACGELDAMLDEADEFCRTGDALLTLATPPEARQFRSWYLNEFIAQIAGAQPTAWPDFQHTDDHRAGDQARP